MLKKLARGILISTGAMFLMASMTVAQQAAPPASSGDILDDLEKLQLELVEIKTMLESKKIATLARQDLAEFKEEVLVKLGLWRGRLGQGMIMAIEAEKETRALLDRVRKLEEELAKKPEVKLVPQNTYRVKKGDSLWRISSYRNIYDDPNQWQKIYQANRDKIKDPNSIYIGQRLFIPPKSQHRVLEGENLFEIANYESIYNEPLEWRTIFEANRDKIKNANRIYPGQVLVIPQG